MKRAAGIEDTGDSDEEDWAAVNTATLTSLKPSLVRKWRGYQVWPPPRLAHLHKHDNEGEPEPGSWAGVLDKIVSKTKRLPTRAENMKAVDAVYEKEKRLLPYEGFLLKETMDREMNVRRGKRIRHKGLLRKRYANQLVRHKRDLR